MHTESSGIDPTSILYRNEVLTVVEHLRLRCRTSANARVNLALFRLCCGAGLRVSEACDLQMRDVELGEVPALHLRREAVKGKRRGRTVPLYWDAGTVADLRIWAMARKALPADPFLIAPNGHKLTRSGASRRWYTALKPLGMRRERLSIHSGRRTFISHALHVGRSLVEVKQAAGHANLATTSIYAHVIPREGIPDLYGG